MQNNNGKLFHETIVIFMPNAKKNSHVLDNVLAHLSTKAFKTRFVFQTIRQYSTKIFPSYLYDTHLVPIMKENFKSFYKYSKPPGSR